MSKQINEAFQLLENYIPPNIPNADKDGSKFADKSDQPNDKAKTERLNITKIRMKSSNLYSVGYDRIYMVFPLLFVIH